MSTGDIPPAWSVLLLVGAVRLRRQGPEQRPGLTPSPRPAALDPEGDPLAFGPTIDRVAVGRLE